MTHCGISSWHISVFILHTCQCTIMSCNTSKIYSLDVDLTYGTGGIWPDIYFEKVYSPTPLVFSFSNIQSMSILNILRFRKRFSFTFPWWYWWSYIIHHTPIISVILGRWLGFTSGGTICLQISPFFPAQMSLIYYLCNAFAYSSLTDSWIPIFLS